MKWFLPIIAVTIILIATSSCGTPPIMPKPDDSWLWRTL